MANVISPVILTTYLIFVIKCITGAICSAYHALSFLIKHLHLMLYHMLITLSLQFLHLGAGDTIDLRTNTISYRNAHITLCISMLPAPLLDLIHVEG